MTITVRANLRRSVSTYGAAAFRTPLYASQRSHINWIPWHTLAVCLMKDGRSQSFRWAADKTHCLRIPFVGFFLFCLFFLKWETVPGRLQNLGIGVFGVENNVLWVERTDERKIKLFQAGWKIRRIPVIQNLSVVKCVCERPWRYGQQKYSPTFKKKKKNPVCWRQI